MKTITIDDKKIDEIKEEFIKEFVNNHNPDEWRWLRGIYIEDVWNFIEIKLTEVLEDFVKEIKISLKETEIRGKDATEDFAMDMVLTQMMPDMLDAWLDFYLKENNE